MRANRCRGDGANPRFRRTRRGATCCVRGHLRKTREYGGRNDVSAKYTNGHRADLQVRRDHHLRAGCRLGASELRSQPAEAQPEQKKPNILVIMGDDVGWFNIGAYHRGIMSGKTPNLDKLATQGMLFTDYYAEASCTAGRANFITGEIPLRTGLTTVGQAGADVGLPDKACTLATALKAHGLCHRPVRQEPPRRPEQVPADGARLRRVLRLPLSPRRDVGPLLVRLSPGLDRQDRPAQSGALLGDRHGRSDRATALGQDRQAEDRR